MFTVFQAVGKCVPKTFQLNVKADTPSFQPPWKQQIGFSNIGKGVR